MQNKTSVIGKGTSNCTEPVVTFIEEKEEATEEAKYCMQYGVVRTK